MQDKRGWLAAALLVALGSACGGSGASQQPDQREAARASVDDTPSDAPLTPESDGDRPGWPSCGQCRAIIHVDADDVRRVTRVEFVLDASTTKATNAPMYHDATLELAPLKGDAESIKLDVRAWKPGEPVRVTLEAPALEPAPAAWQGSRATLTLRWKSGGTLDGRKLDVPVEVVSDR